MTTDAAAPAVPDSPTAVAVDVTAVVVTYNAPDWTQRCLRALPETTSRDLEVVVVDNGSRPETRNHLRDWAGPDAQVQLLDDNIGFGNACNYGAAIARGRYVVLVNPDAVLEPGSIDALLEYLEADPGVGVVGGRTFTPEGKLNPSSCWGRQTTWSLACFALGLSSVFRRSAALNPEGMGGWPRDTARDVDVVTGCLLAMSKSLWDRLAGFDPDFFMYGEDADLCLRAAELGYRSAITPRARAVHAVGASSAARIEKQRLVFRGKASLVLKHERGLHRRADLALLQGGVGVRAAMERATGRGSGAWRQLWQERRAWRRGWTGDWRPGAVAGAGAGAVAGAAAGAAGPAAGPATAGAATAGAAGRSGAVPARTGAALRRLADPRTWLHLVKVANFYGYGHVEQVRRLTSGPGLRMSPTASMRNAERITLGREVHVGEGCYLWAGDHTGRITLGDNALLGPGVFITANNYGVLPGIPIMYQEHQERDVRIGADVWLGYGAVVLPGVTIGDGAVVGASAVVSKDVPAGAIAVGSPCRVVGYRGGERRLS